MPLRTAIYRLAKRAVHAAPPWLLRARPFGVYAVTLNAAVARPATSQSSSIPSASVPSSSVPSAAVRSPAVDARWAQSTDEAQRLGRVASPVNLDRWDGQTCRVAYAVGGDDKPIGAVWVDTKRFAEPDLAVAFDLTDRDAWLHSAYVRPEHRRSGVYTGLLTLVRRTLAAEGYERLLLGVTLGNTPSRLAHERIGAEPIGTLMAARVVGAAAVAASGAVSGAGGARWRLSTGTINLRVDTPHRPSDPL